MTEPDRTQAPPFQLSSDFSLTKPEYFSFSGGQPLYVFRGLQQPVIKLELLFEAGKWYESHLGSSYFTAHLLPKGSASRTSFQIADALDSLGAHLEIVAGFDTVSVSVFVLRKHFLSSLRVILEFLQAPSFPENELRQEKEIFLQNLRINNEKPSVLASKEIRKTIFGESHPYGSSIEEPNVLALGNEDLREFFQNHFVLHAAYLVGSATDEDIRGILEAISQPVPTRKNLTHVELPGGGSHRVAKSGSVQSSIRLAKKCLPKGDNPEYFDAVIFNHLFGGYFGSRLMKNIREEKGLTYGIHSVLNHFRRASFWVISAEVNQQLVEQALAEIKKEIKVMQHEAVPASELDVARNYFIGSWQSDNSTLFAVAEKIKNIHSYGLPEDYYTRLLEHLQRVTPEQILHTANKHFGADDLVEILVG